MTLYQCQRAFRPAAIAACLFAAVIAAFADDEQRTREPAPVMSYHGAQWLERPSRVDEEKPYDVIAYMDLEPGMTVVDLGCGSGYYARKMAPKVLPDGKVLGVDIQPEMLEIMMQLVEREGVENVVPVLGDEKDPKLPQGDVDWIILADVYHEFQYPEEMLGKMLASLKPGGRVCLLEYRDEEFRQASHIKPEHRMTVKDVLKEWNAAGFELIDLQEFLPSQHMFIFQRRPARD
jgi:ubiquinone/menaquinone biosynthesis C-methylase UbiE